MEQILLRVQNETGKEIIVNVTTKKLEELIANKPIKNVQKLKQQQNYYHRLHKKGIAQKETYNLKPISSI